MIPFPRLSCVALGLALAASALYGGRHAHTRRSGDLRQMQAHAIANRNEKIDRPYHFGTQGAGGVFSNHGSHTNRLVPVITLGRSVDLGSITGGQSAYRDPQRLETLYGRVPEHTLNPEAEYGDQADLRRLQQRAVEAGARHLFIVLFDGMDWEVVRAAAIARTGDPELGGSNPMLDLGDGFDADGTMRVGSVVTSPTHEGAVLDLDEQSIAIPDDALRGGFDPRFAGRDPWQAPELDAPGYLRGQGATEEELQVLRQRGGVPHAYTDSSASAAEIASGVKSYNDSVNVGPDGAFLTPYFVALQRDGWKVGTVSSVPFNHASPAAMYARNVSRDDYQDLARDMLGLPSIAVEHGAPGLPGLDVVIGTGVDQDADLRSIQRSQGRNAVAGNRYLSADDLEAIDVEHGGPYVVAARTQGSNGDDVLAEAAKRAAAEGRRLFGFFGTPFGHLPYQTADGAFDPSLDFNGEAEAYTPDEIAENPTLAEMTAAALEVLGADPEVPFALFVEPGDVDWALHANNLDNAVGAVRSGEAALRVILDWVASHGSWDDSAVIITADHGHYLVLDDPGALAGPTP